MTDREIIQGLIDRDDGIKLRQFKYVNTLRFVRRLGFDIINRNK